MNLYLVRAGRYGEQEQTALENKIVTIGWNDTPDLRKFKTREELFKHYKETYEASSNVVTGIKVGQLWKFANEIKPGDVVALPSKFQPIVHIGEVTGPYRYEKITEDVRHILPVKWLGSVPRTSIDQDILYSLGSLLTVSQVNREKAAERIKATVTGKKQEPVSEIELVDSEIDIEEYSRDQIIKFLERKFKGHAFTRLVDEILQAQGYTTLISKPGADGGVDILASAGGLGFEGPKICVQVKSTTTQVGPNIYRELIGVMSKKNADFGLFVSWSGYNDTVLKENKDDFFRVRLWNANDILNAIFKYYDKFNEDFKADLPLKKVWCLVEEDEKKL